MNTETKIKVIRNLLSAYNTSRLSVLVELAGLDKDSDLSSVVLSKIRTDGPDDLSYFNFSNTDLSNADLKGCDLMGANFTGANLNGTNLEGCNLVNAVFLNACLRNTNFTDTTF